MATWLPFIEVHDLGYGVDLSGPPEALRQLADSFSGDVLSAEVTPDDGSKIFVRVTGPAPVRIRHQGLEVEITGGRDELDHLAHVLRFVADAPTTRSTVSYHAHVKHFPGHLWLAADSEPSVVTLIAPSR
jgi:hypothetical protein